MPIRNITVDWDFDNRITGGNPGKFKNKKTRCSTNRAASSCANNVNVTCSNDAECTSNGLGACSGAVVSFGNSPDACEKGFHEFFGSYNFQPDDTTHCNYKVGTNNPAGITAAQLTSNGLSFGDRYCAFKPRVIIIDNWGWCNGGSGQAQDVGGCKAGNGGCWGNPEDERENICVRTSAVEYSNGLVGTKFNGWVIVAEQK